MIEANDPTPPTDREEFFTISQVVFQNTDGKLCLYLPSSLVAWQDILLQLQQRLLGADRFWQKEAFVTLVAADREVEVGHFQDMRKFLAPHDLQIDLVITSCLPTAIAAATTGLSVQQTNLGFSSPVVAPLYLKTIVRSGMEIEHPGSVILWGDVHPGGAIIAEGDILIWGKLKGKAHAGSQGNGQAVIMALHLEALQLQIAGVIARVEDSNQDFYPEIAYLSRKKPLTICIVPTFEYKFSLQVT